MAEDAMPTPAHGWLRVLLPLVLLALALSGCAFEGETCGRAYVRFPARSDEAPCVCQPQRCVEPGPPTSQH